MTGELSPSPHSTTATSADGEWRGLSVRVIWVDLAQSVLSVLPGVIAIALFGVEPTFAMIWPFALIAAWGVIGAITDVIRWIFTRYRITDTDIERRTGVFVRSHRSVRRDRIRSVDTHAKLRHRVAGLRVVTIGAGQQSSSGEAAFVLDALPRHDAELLRRMLFREQHSTAASDTTVHTSATAAGAIDTTAEDADLHDDAEVLATLRPWWVVYNMFSIWAYLTAAGLLWGGFWLAATFGIDLIELSSRFVNWDEIGWVGTVVIALIGGGIIGAIGMGLNFFTTNWRFTLARVRTAGTSFLRTRRGLFSTREINRDESRMRGLSIGEPLLWRWMRMADTNVITTGLALWDMNEPTAILPRGPKSVSMDVAARVLGEPCPINTPLQRHPTAALRRRLWWATGFTATVVGFIAVPVATGAVPTWVLWATIGVWPVALGAAVIAYRALGHAISGDYLVVRAGLLSRTTSALRRDAVSTIAVRQSLLQKRLGLSTVSAMTAAGWSVYEAPDVATSEATSFAALAAPGLIDEFLDSRTASSAI